MKNIHFLFGLISLCLLFSCTKPVTKTFYVEGNCIECKTVIEEKLTELEGVVASNWDFETSLLTVAINPDKLIEDQVQEFIAEQGFETQYFPANPETRKSLPACCQEAISRQLKRLELEIPNH